MQHCCAPAHGGLVAGLLLSLSGGFTRGDRPIFFIVYLFFDVINLSISLYNFDQAGDPLNL